jgi:hypothetical protein
LAVIAGRPTRGALLPARFSALTDSKAGRLAIFIVRRTLRMIPIVFFVILITFFLMHLAPGSPGIRPAGASCRQW